MVEVKVTTCTKNTYLFKVHLFKVKNTNLFFQKESKIAQAYDTVNSMVGWTDNGKYKQIFLLKMTEEWTEIYVSKPIWTY